MPTSAYIELCSESDDDVDGMIILKEQFRQADGMEQRDLLQDWIATLQALNASLDLDSDGENVTGDAIVRLSPEGTKLHQQIGKDHTIIWEGERRSGH